MAHPGGEAALRHLLSCPSRMTQALVKKPSVFSGCTWWQVCEQGAKREPLLCHEKE